MKDKKYSLYNKILELDDYTTRYIVVSIPKVYNNIRIHFQDEMYNLKKNMFYAVYNKGNIRMKYLVELQVNISLIDMMLNQLRMYDIIKKHNIDVAISKLSDIKNIIYGWKFNEEKSK